MITHPVFPISPQCHHFLEFHPVGLLGWVSSMQVGNVSVSVILRQSNSVFYFISPPHLFIPFNAHLRRLCVYKVFSTSWFLSVLAGFHLSLLCVSCFVTHIKKYFVAVCIIHVCVLDQQPPEGRIHVVFFFATSMSPCTIPCTTWRLTNFLLNWSGLNVWIVQVELRTWNAFGSV